MFPDEHRLDVGQTRAGIRPQRDWRGQYLGHIASKHLLNRDQCQQQTREVWCSVGTTRSFTLATNGVKSKNMDDSLQQKLDARARHQLARDELKGSIEVLIRTDAPPTPQQQAELSAAGCNMRSAAGNVVSATVAQPSNLDQVARLPFVRRIEVSRPMYSQSQGN